MQNSAASIPAEKIATGALVASAGELFVNAGLSVARPVTVKDGARFTVKGTSQASLKSLTLESGATLNIDTYTSGVTPVALTSGLTLPPAGTATLLRNGGAFPADTYAILALGGITASEVNGKLVPSLPSGLAGRWYVEAGTLYLQVGDSWPESWNGGHAETSAMKAAYDAWAQSNNWKAPDAESAFLLGVDTADYNELAVTAITVADGKVAIDTNQSNLTKANGKVYVLVGATPDAFTSGTATKLPASVGNTLSELVDIDAASDSKFFRVGVGYSAP